jgi:cobalt-zinc-cadmium efflux system membrane fusion protein
MAHFEVRAPLAGIINHVSAGAHEPVEEGQALLQIINLERVWVEARVPETMVGALPEPQNAFCEGLDGSGRLIAIQDSGGRFLFGGLEVDSATRTVPLIFELNNEDAQLRIGQAVRMQLAGAPSREAVSIPDSALVEEGGVFIAFVRVGEETFERRELSLGIRDGPFVEVISGVRPGESVVVRGAYALRLASASAALPEHGHSH